MAKLHPPGETPISLRLDSSLLEGVEAWLKQTNDHRDVPLTRTDLLRGLITWAVKTRPTWEPDPAADLQQKWDTCVRGDWMAQALVPMAEKYTRPVYGIRRPFLADMMFEVVSEIAKPPADALAVLDRMRMLPAKERITFLPHEERANCTAELAAMLAAAPCPSKETMADHRRPEVQAQIARHFALSAANCGPADIDKCFLMAQAAHATRKVQDNYSDDEYAIQFQLGAVAAATIIKQYVPLAPASFDRVWKKYASQRMDLAEELRTLTPGA